MTDKIMYSEKNRDNNSEDACTRGKDLC